MEIKITSIAGNEKTAVVAKINVKVGELVEKGQILAELATKKCSSTIKSETSGTIEAVLIEIGQSVEAGQTIMTLAPSQKESENVSDKTPKKSGMEFDYFGSLVKGKKEEINTKLLIIGAGPGGYVAAAYAAKQGIETILVERESLGGTCLNWGCIPTKALVKSSEVYNQISRSSEFGIDVAGIKKDMKKIISRKNEIRDTLVSGVEYLMEKNKVRVIKGSASFLDDKTIFIKSGRDEYTVFAENTIIATGSKICEVKIDGIKEDVVMNSTQALDFSEDIESLTIIGGGVIGMEFAFIYSGFGVKVNVVEYCDRLLTMVDSEISQEIKDIAVKKGIKIYTSSAVKRIQKDENGKAVVFFENDNHEKLIVSDKVIVAIGREPDIQGLGIENTKISMNENQKGIKTDEHMQTTSQGIYAIGDVNNKMQLAHVASHQGMIAVDCILGKSSKMNYLAVPNVIFTAPEIASIGETQDSAAEKDLKFTVSRFPFCGNGRALTMGEPEGFVKLIRDTETGMILGGSIIGPEASALIGTLSLAISNQLSDKDIAHTVFAHPTTGETIHEAAMDFGIGAIHI